MSAAIFDLVGDKGVCSALKFSIVISSYGQGWATQGCLVCAGGPLLLQVRMTNHPLLQWTSLPKKTAISHATAGPSITITQLGQHTAPDYRHTFGFPNRFLSYALLSSDIFNYDFYFPFELSLNYFPLILFHSHPPWLNAMTDTKTEVPFMRLPDGQCSFKCHDGKSPSAWVPGNR